MSRSSQAPVIILIILIVQVFDCTSLSLHDRGVCEEIIPHVPLLRIRLSGNRTTETQENKGLVCCNQYEYIPDLDLCAPICSQGCINGICTDVDTCTCTPPLTLQGHTCVPSTCSNCEHGDCVAPNDCRCHNGYIQSNGTCAPICDKVCVNGQCVKPNTCQCNNGYKVDRAKGFHCSPICDAECIHGTCTAHNKCTCNDGYEKTNNDFVCKPICAACEFGHCIAPHNCSCFEGYGLLNGTCKPKCSHCGDENCIGPEKCRSPVEPVADQIPTINGNCPTPYCICSKDYDLTCSVICNHGYCSRPGDCTCKPKKKGAIFNSESP